MKKILPLIIIATFFTHFIFAQFNSQMTSTSFNIQAEDHTYSSLSGFSIWMNQGAGNDYIGMYGNYLEASDGSLYPYTNVTKSHISVIDRENRIFLENGSLYSQDIVGFSWEDRFRLNENSLTFTNDASWKAFEAGINGSSAGYINLFRGGGSEATINLFNVGNAGRITLRNLGEQRVFIGVASNAGDIRTYGSNNKPNTFLSSFGSNGGYLGVQDDAGVVQAGMYVDAADQGIIFADVKNFRIPHPAKSDKEIWYACIEGPEAAAYVRGTAELSGGETFVPFPEHFSLISNPQSMTVILTPLDAASYGLAVVKKTKNGIYVKELANGTGNYEFDWEVKCVRTGYEDFKVVRDKDTVVPAFIEAASETNKSAVKEETAIDVIEEDEAILEERAAQDDADIPNAKRTPIHLKQNRPNPFSKDTEIEYYLPKYTQDAFLQVVSVGEGKIVAQIPLSTDNRSVTLAGSELAAGYYTYSLVADGKILETKKMLLLE